MSLNEESGVLRCSKHVQTKYSHKRKRPKQCHKTMLQNIGMWLQKHIVTHEQISRFTVYWLLLKPQWKDFLLNDTVIAAQTWEHRCSYLREMCHYTVSQNNKKLGSVKTVETDKAKTGHRKYIIVKVKHVFNIATKCTFIFNMYFDFYHICSTCFGMLNIPSSGIILYYLHKTICFLQ
jgi:hypothetical protein